MINIFTLKEIATREQTPEINVLREYTQHLFLKTLYQQDGSNAFLFKGGTAIRLIYSGSRYSEDLDFSMPQRSKTEIEDVFMESLTQLEKEGVAADLTLTEATETTGGYLMKLQVKLLDFPIEIKSNIQLKHDPAWLGSETHIITNAFSLPAYSLVALRGDLLVQEKIQALMERHKPRDVFDAYFFSRHATLRPYLPRNPENAKRIQQALEAISDHDLETDLKPFLPRNYQSIIKQLKSLVRAEFGIIEK